jgi:cell division protein FtsQ
MKNFYSIGLLLTVFIFLTTYTPNQIEFNLNKKNSYFNIQNILILNTNRIDKNEVELRLSNIYEKNIFFIKIQDLYEPLKSIYFLDKIEVKKKYPNTLILKISETEPIAFFLKDNKNFLLDSKENLIPVEKINLDNNYPYIYGLNADKNFLNMLSLLNKAKFPVKKIKSYYYFKIGRWDLKLENNQLIKLPNEETKKAIAKLIELLKQEDFKNYEVIDLRINDRIIVE